VLELLAHGRQAPQVATELGLSPETVRTHVRNAMRKLEATTRVQAVALAVESVAVSPTAPRSAA
jgi:DNA-binding CsgD family transcriptional regulator